MQHESGAGPSTPVETSSAREAPAAQTPAEEANRRPIASRGNPLMQRLARAMANTGITPNIISVASIVFAVLGALSLLCLPGAWGLLGCALGIQLRLLCNLIDGMVAIEGGKKTPTGSLYNEVPDRVADSVLIIALGYAVGMPWLGWLGALAAACTAYVRVLGGSLGLPQSFRGPMAKQHRMAVLTIACLLAMAEQGFNQSQYSLWLAAWIIALGSLITCITRLQGVAAQLREQAAQKGER